MSTFVSAQLHRRHNTWIITEGVDAVIMKKKSLIMLVCALMIMSSVAFGTIAYLTDRAGVTNRFTIGNVDIVVDETEVDEDGNPVEPPQRTEEENEYPLIPGSEYVKDPTMTVKAKSEEAYVRMMVTITNAAELKDIFAELAVQYPEKYANGFVPEQHVTGWDNAEWNFISMTEDTTLNTFTLEFRYPTTVEPTDTEDIVLPALFDTIKVPGELTNEHLTRLENFTIDVYGNAIQTTGFATADEAWAAFDAQMTVTATAAPTATPTANPAA